MFTLTRRLGALRFGRSVPTLAITGWLFASPAAAQTTQEVRRMSLQDLMQLEITTVSRQPEPTSLTPAAVHVITNEDIRRSGATTLAEVLRLAPGLQVARLDSARWAVGMRGFTDRLSRSMLVLMDGRAVYSPLFAGTYWEVQDTLLEDVERIEVVRGPGGTLWGANAVNGVINIITKRASETHGALASAATGFEERGLGAFRYGAAMGESGHMRGYVKGAARDTAFHPGGQDFDEWWKVQAGFRSDWALANARTLTIQGDAYGGQLGQQAITMFYTPPFSTTATRDAALGGGNVLARWSGPIGARADFQLQTFYDRTSRDERPVKETRDTVDVDFQQHLRHWDRHDVAWGAGYRVSSGRITATWPTQFSPPSRTDNLFSAFIQDEFAIAPNRVRLTFGGKIEHNEYSGFELQPSARMIWIVDAANTIVGSVTRAVRTPSRVETDYTTMSLVSAAPPTFVRLLGNPGFMPEKVVAYEAIYRVRPADELYVSVSGFFNQLDDILSTELVGPSFVETSPGVPRLVLPVSFMNGLHGNSHGFEVTTDLRPLPWWRSIANYSFLRIQLTRDPGSRDVSQERRNEGLSPRHQFELQTSFDLPRSVSFDWLLRYVSDLPAGPVPSYATSDVRVAWRLSNQLEMAVVGQNLHEARHLEWPSHTGSQIERAAYVTFTWRQQGGF